MLRVVGCQPVASHYPGPRWASREIPSSAALLLTTDWIQSLLLLTCMGSHLDLASGDCIHSPQQRVSTFPKTSSTVLLGPTCSAAWPAGWNHSDDLTKIS